MNTPAGSPDDDENLENGNHGRTATDGGQGIVHDERIHDALQNIFRRNLAASTGALSRTRMNMYIHPM
jgi:hypothetical protein